MIFTIFKLFLRDNCSYVVIADVTVILRNGNGLVIFKIGLSPYYSTFAGVFPPNTYTGTNDWLPCRQLGNS